MGPRRVLILGGGFAGAYTAIAMRLERRLRRRLAGLQQA